MELDNYELTVEESEEFAGLIDETFHNRTLGVILNSLPVEYHENFLSMVCSSPHRSELMEFLKEKSSPDIEKIIQKEAEKIKKEILLEIKRSKRK